MSQTSQDDRDSEELSRFFGTSKQRTKLEAVSQTYLSTPATELFQLATYRDIAVIHKNLSIKPLNGGTHALVWKGTDEKVELHVQGFISRTSLPPVLKRDSIGRGPFSSQSVTIVGPDVVAFKNSILGLRMISLFMSTAFKEGCFQPYVTPTWVDHSAILLRKNYYSKVNSSTVPVIFSSTEDPLHIMRDNVPSGFVHTADNQVQYYTWEGSGSNITLEPIEPALFRVGHIVDVTVTISTFCRSIPDSKSQHYKDQGRRQPKKQYGLVLSLTEIVLCDRSPYFDYRIRDLDVVVLEVGEALPKRRRMPTKFVLSTIDEVDESLGNLTLRAADSVADAVDEVDATIAVNAVNTVGAVGAVGATGAVDSVGGQNAMEVDS